MFRQAHSQPFSGSSLCVGSTLAMLILTISQQLFGFTSIERTGHIFSFVVGFV